MADNILKKEAIQIIRDVIGKNQGCSEIYLYDKYKEKGGTYYISGRNGECYSVEEIFESMSNLGLLSREKDSNGKFHYYVNDFVKKEVEIGLPNTPTNCSECRFCKEDNKKYTCLIDLYIIVTENMYIKDCTFLCPLRK